MNTDQSDLVGGGTHLTDGELTIPKLRQLPWLWAGVVLSLFLSAAALTLTVLR